MKSLTLPPRRFVCVAFALAGFAAAQQAASPLKLVLSQLLVQTVTKNGKTQEEFVPVSAVHPGDVLQQSVKASNTGRQPLKNIALQLPVPANEVFMKADESVYRAQYSIDGGKTYAAAPITRKITVTENGKTVTKEVVVQPSEYTNVRWVVPTLNPSDSVTLTARFKVR
ncbi:hypothetical protein E5F05_03180 (plasmid) [Deinococcus metallilatus]|uniref:DUF11 domain-containing protein n=1 Tax=Deinococcus metallilatus TaxID=1211322 RepID=A0AAJ5F8H4_9DEIO|nr:hypothetical protein [Deinococcus metallilatus]MBB5297371.1 hypothetical protein [Deinococcus metallilatus]QBY06936.1 hypothetical protein E5F05_03180 [Deinococcus metallilatus]TLK32326.1 hypothetical protein FCS05_02515 [Deinococcus metallilatus]GMA17076.1 hypothetical protein GCM10025871_34070 [Deinococcus metallilatus]